jgi:hypothetical protein
MSEGSITYQGDGDTCGIFTVINSELRSHRVCSDGLACMPTAIGNDVTTKICQSVEVLIGERCLPNYDMCYGGVECMKNVNGDYTCGGEEVWIGNPSFVMSGYVKASEFKMNITLIVIGCIVLFLYFLFIVYEVFIKKKGTNKSIYSKLFNVNGAV